MIDFRVARVGGGWAVEAGRVEDHAFRRFAHFCCRTREEARNLMLRFRADYGSRETGCTGSG